MEIKNIKSFKDFKELKEGSTLITETVINQGDAYQVNKLISVPKSLVKALAKKVKDESGKNVVEEYSEAMLAEMIIDFVTTSFMNIENLPTSIILGSSTSVQPKAQETQTQPTETETQTQNSEENVQAAATAQTVPAQETPAQAASAEGSETPQGGTAGVQTPAQAI